MTIEQVRAEAAAWYAANWDPDLTVGEWWGRLARSGWGYPAWPTWAFGRGQTGDEARAAFDERRRAGAVGPPSGIGPTLAAPTLIAHATREQVARFLPDLVAGVVWCQLFSEPGAGSDLAGLGTVAVPDGDRWIVNGQKVWTSGAHLARWGMLIARTSMDVPKHRGITFFVIDLHQPGVEVRPLREMTGRSLFNEVFLTDAVVADADRIGAVNDGWRVALTTLAHERNSLGPQAIAEGGSIVIGKADLDRRVGDLSAARSGQSAPSPLSGGGVRYVVELAHRFAGRAEPALRDRLMASWADAEVARLTGLRAAAAAAAGRAPGAEVSIQKLAASRNQRRLGDVALAIAGPFGSLAGDDAPDRGRPQILRLSAPVLSIGGGTDEIQHNIIGERVLGLPREPDDSRDLPFRQVRRS